MLELVAGEPVRSVCQFTSSPLPTFVNPLQPPTKKRPFSTINAHDLNHTLNVLVPLTAAPRLQTQLDAHVDRYARVHMKPLELLEGDFFNKYIKTGNILMISEGRRHVDNTLTLCRGVLRLEVDVPTYERMGLQGTVIASPGRKHIVARRRIELDLRQPAMVHGKKGFERIVSAFKTVLDHALTWLFYDLEDPRLEHDEPLQTFAPAYRDLKSQSKQAQCASVPSFPSNASAADGSDEDVAEVLEWLTLAMIASPRITIADRIDPYLCRYTPLSPAVDDPTSGPLSLVCLQWQGLLPATFITKILLAAFKSCGEHWFALSATTFTENTYMILKTEQKTLTWEYDD